MNESEQKAVVLRFNEFINSRDIDGLAALMTDDHIFIDSGNNTFQGREQALEAWRGFFELFPDYRNDFESIESQDNLVVVAGHSSCSDKRLDGPALWTAKVENNKVAEWRIYDDTPDDRKRLGIK